jgi:hypothetical protein
MEARNTILKELLEISPAVANLTRENTFSVPYNYFNTLAESILLRIKAEEMSFSSKTNPFEVPQGYFEGLASEIMAKINKQQTVAEELSELAPILNTIKKEPVYSIPEGYFESLELTIPLKLDKPSAKVFNFSKPKRWMQYAVAACTAGILMIGAFFYVNKGNDNSIISYKEAKKMDVQKEIASVNEEVIANYLDETPSVGYTVSSNEETDVEDYLETISDEEIKQYLNESAGS